MRWVSGPGNSVKKRLDRKWKWMYIQIKYSEYS